MEVRVTQNFFFFGYIFIFWRKYFSFLRKELGRFSSQN